MSTTALPQTLQQIRDEAVALQRRIAADSERLEVLKEAIRENLEPDEYGSPDTGQILVASPNRAFSEEVAQQIIPADRFPWKRVPDKDAIKEMDPSGRLYQDCLVPTQGKKKVSFV